MISDTFNVYFKWDEDSKDGAVDASERDQLLEAHGTQLKKHSELMRQMVDALQKSPGLENSELEAVSKTLEKAAKKQAKADKKKKAKKDAEDEDSAGCCNKECLMNFKCLLPLINPIMDMLGIENPLADLVDGMDLEGLGDALGEAGDMIELDMEGDEESDSDEKPKKRAAKTKKGKKKKGGLGGLKKGLKAASKISKMAEDDSDDDSSDDDDMEE